jgi:hypothetical protein
MQQILKNLMQPMLKMILNPLAILLQNDGKVVPAANRIILLREVAIIILKAYLKIIVH